MPEVVEADLRHPGVPARLLEALREDVRDARPARLVAQDEAVSQRVIAPAGAERQALLRLSPSVLLERPDGDVTERDEAASGLGLHVRELKLVARGDERPGDREALSLKIDVRPAHPSSSPHRPRTVHDVPSRLFDIEANKDLR
jgi:hypothetical protein